MKFNEHDLLRTDAIGNRARREKFYQANREEARARNKVEEWRIELEHWEGTRVADGLSQGEIDKGRQKTSMKVAEWGSRMRSAATDIEKLKPQILSAWD